MSELRKKVYVTAGYNTTFFGPGRKEFNPKKPMPGFETYLKEAAQGTLSQLENPDFDEGVIGNFMAGRFLKQGNLPGFLPFLVPGLRGKSCTRVEGACASGGLALIAAIKSVLSDTADAVFVLGFEVQNIVKAIYGADYLAGAGYFNGERKNGHAYFFPNMFSERAGAYSEKFGKDLARKGMARWYQAAIENARKNPKAQEYHNKVEELFERGMTPCNPKTFLEHLNLYDCSKVSDGASSLVILSEAGLERTGTRPEDCIEIAGFAQCQDDVTRKPEDPSFLWTTGKAANEAMEAAGAKKDEIAVFEAHDCFSITGLIALESIGFVERGRAPEFLLDGHTTSEGSLPVNPSGGLCGFGHPTGATGVRQMVDLLHQFTGKAENQVDIRKPYGLMVNMGGNDKTLGSIVVKRPAS